MTENSNGVIILITLLNILVYKLQQLQEAKFIEHTNQLSLNLQRLCRRFSLRDIQWATFNFQDELVIGQGGFGKVYRGIIDFGALTVAIKRLKSTSKQGSKEFLTEIEMLSKFQHSHVVSLVGYCDECDEMILVYEYMPCGTLADHLHKRVRNGDTSSPPLSWEQRLKICIGAARGLEYLHTGTSVEHRVIHRDVKSSNILLDENMAAKISDFGMSKIGPSNQAFSTYVSTRVKGTPGYMDPYYFETLRLTRKSDVYGFGVVLFEVLCGRPAVDNSLDDEQRGLAGWAQHCFKDGLLDQIIDPTIKGEIFPNSLVAFVRVAIQCLHNGPKHRPTMAEVVVGLESALALQQSSTIYILPEVPLINCSSQVNVNANSSTLEGQIVKYNQEHVDSSMVGGNQGNLRSPIVEVDIANHNQENKNSSLEKGVINDADGGHHDEQSTARMTFTEKLSMFLSGRARMFSRKTLPKPMFSVENAEGREGGGEDQNGGDQKEQKDGSVQRRGERRRRPNPRLSNPPKNVHGEQVAAGWPSRLSAVAGEAINGWTPRPAQSFEKIDWGRARMFSGHSKAEPLRNRRSNNNNRVANMSVVNDEGVNQEASPNLKMFTLAELRKATSGFRPDMVLGEGGFGKVYKGWVHEKTYAPSKLGVGMAIAVKRLASLSQQGFEEEQTEIQLLGNYSNPNLVKLLGYCQEDEELLLVYEYMEKGSLEIHLFNSAEQLPWSVRLKVLIGAGRCLAFFHTAEKPVIHRDFKTSNIFLDGEFNAKISNLGLAKIGPVNNDTHVSTQVIGTYGYAAPEYVATGHLGVKCDVYGFGVVFLELLTGMKVRDVARGSEKQNLVDWAKPYLVSKRKVRKILDPSLAKDFRKGAMLSVVSSLILECLNPYPKNRPSMIQVLETLETLVPSP